MFDEVNRALDEYFGKWRALIDARQDERNKEFFERLKPTTVGWKVADYEEYKKTLDEWRASSDLISEKWMNGRWIAYLHLRDVTLNGGIEVFEILQARPDRSDVKVGLDFVDFFCMEEENARAILEEENDIQSTKEENSGVRWISIWFDGTEAKLKAFTAFDVAEEEARRINNKIRGQKFAVMGREAGVVTTEVE